MAFGWVRGTTGTVSMGLLCKRESFWRSGEMCLGLEEGVMHMQVSW